MITMEFQDKLLPIQPGFKEFFPGDIDSMIREMNRVVLESSGLLKPQNRFRLVESDQVPLEHMASSPLMLRLMAMLVRLTGAKNVLEIGTFLGISGMSMAEELPEGGRVVTVEKYDHFAALARKNFIENKLDSKIEIVIGDALEKIDELKGKGPYDLFFLDGNKENYLEYLQKLECSVRKGGLIVIDDVFFQGDALNEKPTTPKGQGVKDLLEAMKTDEKYYKLILPISNGVMLLHKLT